MTNRDKLILIILRWMQAPHIKNKHDLVAEELADRIIAEEGKGLLGACEMAIKMLNYINCPECDGSGAKQISEDEVAQCQWCDEKNKIQQAIVGAENKQPQQPKLPERWDMEFSLTIHDIATKQNEILDYLKAREEK